MTADAFNYRPSPKAVAFCVVVALLGGITLGVGLFLAPDRTWINLLLVSYYLVGLGLGGLLLVALHYVTGARWSLPLRRVPEAMTAVLPWATVGLVAVLLCRPSLYPWVARPSFNPEPAATASGTVAAGSGFNEGRATQPSDSPLKHFWLNREFFVLRGLVYLALWLAFALAIVRASRRQDRDRDPAPTRKNIRLSATFLMVFAVTCWLASYDWIMSLEPEWASTVFGVYNFAGLFLSALAAVILLVIWLGRYGPLRPVLNESHLHDLGTLLFAMSSFWMYTWFCQYLLIWYVNNPEETAYLRRRWQGGWAAWLFLDLALNWVIPFLVLLSRGAKRNPRVLGTVAVVVLAGRWVDLFLMIFPSQAAEASMPGPLEAGLLLGAAGLFAVAVFRGLSKASLVPTYEPSGFEETLIVLARK
jgi:hypothetical protein